MRLLTRKQATDFLGIKAQTLYAYVSRGLVRKQSDPETKKVGYVRADLEQLKVRQTARSGHHAAAAAALRSGAPVLDTSITEIRQDGPYFRGHSALALARRGTPFE